MVFDLYVLIGTGMPFVLSLSPSVNDAGTSFLLVCEYDCACFGRTTKASAPKTSNLREIERFAFLFVRDTVEMNPP